MHLTLHTLRIDLTTQAASKRSNVSSGPLSADFFSAKSMQITLDKSTYNLEAVQKAAYRFIDRLTIVISSDDLNFFCDISPISTEIDLNSTIDDFKREVLDQELRLKIKNETEDVRNLILAYAFSKTGLQE